jgi:hypothetical protein
MFSKYLPAEAGALDCEPLKATWWSLTRPQFLLATLSVAAHRYRFNWSNRWFLALLVPDDAQDFLLSLYPGHLALEIQ